MKILISGFEPFDKMKFNPSQELMSLLLDEKFNFEIETIVLPVDFSSCFPVLKAKIKTFGPDVIIGTGLAHSRKEITIERIAINLVDARIADNKGNQPRHDKIIKNGPDGIFTKLPLEQMAAASLKVGVAANISNTAGTFVCNYLMYQIVHYANENHLIGGFIHLPPTLELDPQGMPIQDMLKGFASMLRAIEAPVKTNINFGSED